MTVTAFYLVYSWYWTSRSRLTGQQNKHCPTGKTEKLMGLSPAILNDGKLINIFAVRKYRSPDDTPKKNPGSHLIKNATSSLE